MGWHDERFEPNDSKVRFDCLSCGRGMWFPKSKHGKYRTCGDSCAKELRASSKSVRERACKTCGDSFFPRQSQLRSGHGIYCSSKCNEAAHKAMNTSEARAKSEAGFKLAMAEGRYAHPTGEAHPNWNGGYEAYRKRAKENGKLAEWTRRYRANNKVKVREFTLRRKHRAVGRLPRGTIARIGEAQRWKCAICKVNAKREYHVDHIEPLARGGKHAANNIQILCPACNVRKGAKDPLTFMQARGFLL